MFSVYRSDVICYGSNIVDYFQREFAHGVKPWPAQCAHVDFWSDLASGEDYTRFW